jgi:hypothetical protein
MFNPLFGSQTLMRSGLIFKLVGCKYPADRSDSGVQTSVLLPVKSSEASVLDRILPEDAVTVTQAHRSIALRRRQADADSGFHVGGQETPVTGGM